jgi:CDP-diacylglycerol--serine O-phosphatidyltransferase
MKILNWIPNALTLTNLTLGTMAIFTLMNGAVPMTLMLMAGCLVADMLDGAIARKLDVGSGLGIQLDSLADVVSFGVLPAMLIFFSGSRFDRFPGPEIVAIFAALTAASAGLRLARFNIDSRPREYFWGLATPAGAILVAGIIWAEYVNRDYGFNLFETPALALGVSLFLIIAFQVPLKLPSLKSPKPALMTAIILVIAVVGGFFIIGPISIPIGVFTYVALGVLNLLVKWY